jgi:hypothetical protein
MTRWDSYWYLCGLLRTGLFGGPALPPPATLDWRAMIALSSEYKVSPSLAWCLRTSEALPADVRDYFGAVLQLNAERNAQLVGLLARATAALNGAGIVPVALKGAANLLDNLFPEPGARLLGDLDIVVPHARAQDALAALLSLGLQQTGDGSEHHFPMLIDTVNGGGIELHWRIMPARYMSVIDPADFSTNVRMTVLDGTTLALPSPRGRIAHNIAHTALHHAAFAANELDLRQLLDLAMLVARYQADIDWTSLQACFDAAGHGAVLATHLHYIEGMFGVVPHGFRSAHPARSLGELRESIEPDLVKRIGGRFAKLRREPLSAFRLLDPRRMPFRLQGVRRNLRRTFGRSP